MLDEFPKQVGAMLAAVLTFGPVEAVADSCHSNCDSRYYFCMQGSGVDERGCSTQQTICYMSCRSEAYQAIAYSPRTDHHGYAYSRASRAEAEAAAMDYCRRGTSADGNDCRVVMWSRTACAALATATGGFFGAAWGDPRANAEARALKQCGDGGGKACAIARTVCPAR